MEIGLLWYDGDPRRPLEDKIGQAVERYSEKYGRLPNTCYVHPNAVDSQSGDELRVSCHLKNATAKIRVRSDPYIMRHHFWVGESSDQAA